MYRLEQDISNTLEELCNIHHIIGVKTEFGEEAATVEETLRLKMLASRFGLSCTVKISGCEAVKDIYDSKSVGAESIVAPMIESPYAAAKFIKSMQAVFSPERIENINLYINIETIDGFKNFDRITELPVMEEITGVVFGRSDFISSINLDEKNINSEIVFDYVNQISQKTHDLGKEFIIGGGISPQALKFIQSLEYVSKVETRKIVFDAKSLLNDSNAEDCIKKALEFEILWLQNKQNMFGILSQKDKQRVEILKERCGFVKLCK